VWDSSRHNVRHTTEPNPRLAVEETRILRMTYSGSAERQFLGLDPHSFPGGHPAGAMLFAAGRGIFGLYFSPLELVPPC
jgi:hypothetical protein